MENVWLSKGDPNTEVTTLVRLLNKYPLSSHSLVVRADIGLGQYSNKHKIMLDNKLQYYTTITDSDFTILALPNQSHPHTLENIVIMKKQYS